MTQPNFSHLLDTPSSSVEAPKPLPTGTYVCVVDGQPEMDKSSKKQTEFVRYTLKPLQAQDDVDAEALEAMGGFTNRTIRATYYITEDALWRFKKFLDDCGVPEEDGGEDLSLRHRMGMAPGCQVLATLRHTPSQDGQTIYAELAGTAPVE